jgi:hypothetical protein
VNPCFFCSFHFIAVSVLELGKQPLSQIGLPFSQFFGFYLVFEKAPHKLSERHKVLMVHDSTNNNQKGSYLKYSKYDAVTVPPLQRSDSTVHATRVQLTETQM